MAAGSADSSSASVRIVEKIAGQALKARSSTILVILAYAVGTHHRQLLGTLLRVLVSLGAEVSQG